MSLKIFVFDKPHFPPTREDFPWKNSHSGNHNQHHYFITAWNSATNNFITKLELKRIHEGFQSSFYWTPWV